MDQLREKFFRSGSTGGEEPGSSSSAPGRDSQQDMGINVINPYELGRQARAAFNDVWSQLSRVSSPTRSFIIDDVLEVEPDSDFVAPQAAYTTVLVVGATGRVGRILVRKLLLRGYKVKALFRNRAGVSKDAIPDSVEVVEGDVGDMATCQKAVQGVNKVGEGCMPQVREGALRAVVCRHAERQQGEGYTRVYEAVGMLSLWRVSSLMGSPWTWSSSGGSTGSLGSCWKSTRLQPTRGGTN